MLSLSQTTGYAILALSCLEGADGCLVLAREIAGRTNIPKAYLSKILHALGRSGLIRAKRGYRGGFALTRPANRISLLQVADAVEGRGWIPQCLLGFATCSDVRSCPTHAFWKGERRKIESTLRRTTLAQVAAFERKVGGAILDLPVANGLPARVGPRPATRRKRTRQAPGRSVARRRASTSRRRVR
ncbi:MAG: RrF2 family transcriptional regulator [Planctomycetota bacterium]|jgi:Rrf2 family protein